LTPEQLLVQYLQSNEFSRSVDELENALEEAGFINFPSDLIQSSIKIEEKMDRNGNHLANVIVFPFDPNPDQTGELFEKGIPIGIIVKDEDGVWKAKQVEYKDYAELLGIDIGGYLGDKTRLSEFTTGTAQMGWYKRQPSPTSRVDFSWLDEQIDNGKSKGISNVQFNHLLFPEDYPDWITSYKTGEEVDPILESYFRSVMEHCVRKGVTRFNVYNEPYNPQVRPIDHVFAIFRKSMTSDELELGFNFPIIRVFRIANVIAKEIEEENPGIDIQLGFSNADSHRPNGSGVQQNIEVMQALVKENLVDYLDVHAGTYDINRINLPEENFVTLFQSYQFDKGDGTKTDVDVGEFLLSVEKIQGLPKEKQLIKQAELGSRFFRAVMKAGVKRFTFWGQKDNVNEGLNANLFDDKTLRPKLLYYAILQELNALLVQ